MAVLLNNVYIMQTDRIEARRSREEVKRVLRDLITAGKIQPGARVDEVRLSDRLGVSRTPIREAIIGLEHDGWVRSVPNRGARVVAADEDLVREVYPILAALEAEALQLSGERIVAAADELQALNDRLRTEHRRAQQHALDAAFHRRLIADCANPRVLGLIDAHWALAKRFDGASQRGTANHRGSCDQHQQIIDDVAAGRVAEAAAKLRAHWHQGIEIVSEWLRSND